MATAKRKPKSRRQPTWRELAHAERYKLKRLLKARRSSARIEVYQDHTQAQPQYRWRKVGGNNRIVAVSGEGFNARRYAALRARTEYPGLRLVHKYTEPTFSAVKASYQRSVGVLLESEY